MVLIIFSYGQYFAQVHPLNYILFNYYIIFPHTVFYLYFFLHTIYFRWDTNKSMIHRQKFLILLLR